MQPSLILSFIHSLFHSPVFMDHLLHASHSSKHPGTAMNNAVIDPRATFPLYSGLFLGTGDPAVKKSSFWELTSLGWGGAQ